jgi:hypothetical protein
LWSHDRIQQIKKHHQESARLEVLFGGPHSSEPSFSRYGVKEGDYIYPIRVSKGVLYVIGRMRVKRIISLEEYIEQNPQIAAEGEKNRWPMMTFGNYLASHPERQYLAPTCTSEVVIGEDGTPIRLDVMVPPDLLERLRFRSRKRERGIKHIENGRLKHVISLQGGIYRLSEQSAQEIETLLLSKRKEEAASES